MSDFITVAELRIEAERLCDENERLEAENAELRNDADLLRAMLSQERTEKRYYMAENAKLRELVRDMWNEGMCECGSRGKCARCEYGYPDRMRELGVEVDG